MGKGLKLNWTYVFLLLDLTRLVDLQPYSVLIIQVRGAERGDIRISMRYYEGDSQLIVKVLECKGLKPFPGRVSCSKYYLTQINNAIYLTRVPELPLSHNLL